MKPNDQAYHAARAAILKAMAERNCIIAGVPFNENNYDEFDAGEAAEHSKVALPAAYAAQFPPSEDYAGLVERFKREAKIGLAEECCVTRSYAGSLDEAADALEALLAEREASREKFQYLGELHRQEYDRICAERDALLAGLASVEASTDPLANGMTVTMPDGEEKHLVVAPVEAIENDKDDPTREYIPLPGGWEIQTKGKGSSYRLLDKKTGERHLILAGDAPFVQEFITRMAKEINASAQVRPVAPMEDEALVEIMAEYCYPEIGHATPEKWKHSCRRVARNAIAAIRPHIEAAERERCAKIADDAQYVIAQDESIAGYNLACAEIAAAIRSKK